MYYIEFDEESLLWCVVSEDTGFCKATFCDREEAMEYCRKINDLLSQD